MLISSLLSRIILNGREIVEWNFPLIPWYWLLRRNRGNRGKPKRCCSACSINQRWTHPYKVYHKEAQEQELADLFRPPPKRQEWSGGDADLEGLATLIPTPVPSSPHSPIASQTRKQVKEALKKQAQLSAPPLIIESHKSLLLLYPPLHNSDSEDEEPSSNGPMASLTRK